MNNGYDMSKMREGLYTQRDIQQPVIRSRTDEVPVGLVRQKNDSGSAR